MKKRIISFLLIFILVLLLLPLTVLAAGNLSNFTKTHTYAAGQFGDVPAAQWYTDEVQLAYEYGLVNGTTPTTFSPGQDLTIAEAIKFAACMNEIYSTGALTLDNGKPLWYQPYVDYALSHGIITPYPDYSAYAARSDMAVIFSNALPDDALLPLNSIDDNAIADVPSSHAYSAAVYQLYRAGILEGVDGSHAYHPNSTITRAEVATIVARMADSSARVAFEMSPTGTTPDIPQTTNLSIAVAPSAVTLAKDTQTSVNCTVGSLDFNRIVPVIGDPAVASCTWGIPGGNTFPLTIIGLSAGTTAVTVRLLDADDKVLAETAVNVTVTGSSAEATTAYFSGYYPVPDYGAYAGTAPYYVDYDALNGSTFYAYRISDITTDMDNATDGYIDLLKQNGFVIDDLFYVDDDDIFVLINSMNRLRVYFTNTYMNGIPSIIVKATPY